MKFRIRYADQVVGALFIVALLSLIFVVFLLGRTQQWFSRTYNYVTYAASASGLNQNMPVSCRGIPIGNVKSFRLTDDNQIEVIFTIQSQFNDRAREGSLVEVSVSAIGIGSQFIYYPGLGEELEEWALVPMRDSPEGKNYIAQGLAFIPPSDDSIAVLVDQAVSLLAEFHKTLEGLNVAPDANAITALGQTVTNLQRLTGNLAEDMARPEGIRRIISGDGDAINALEASIVSLSRLLDNLDRTTASLPREMPQISTLIAEVRFAIQSANDVLISLSNNPLLRRGIPDRAEIDTSGSNPRNIRF